MEFSFACGWADFVDPVLPFDETHAQSESGNAVGNARPSQDGLRGLERQVGNADKEPRKEALEQLSILPSWKP